MAGVKQEAAARLFTA